MLKVEPFRDKNVFDNLVFNSSDLSFKFLIDILPLGPDPKHCVK